MITVRLMDNTEREDVRKLIFKSLSRRCQKDYKNGDSTFNVVALIDGVICGTCTVYIHTDDLIGEKDYFLSNLCVDPVYQRIGVASKIIDFIENKGQNDSIRYIYTLVPPKYEETNKLFTKLDYNIRNINCYRKEL